MYITWSHIRQDSQYQRKFAIGRLTLSILNPSSLMLTELQKTLTSIDFFKKDVSLRSRTMREEINVAHEVIVRLIPMWLSSRPRQPEILGMSPPPTPIGSGLVQALTLLAVREWRGLRQENLEEEKETASSRTDSERLHPSRRCAFPQRS